MSSFNINTFGESNGPAIFGGRLKRGIESRGWKFNRNNPDYNLCFASGSRIESAKNILRLDNCYFDSKNTIGNTDKLNAKIKKAYNEFDKIIFQSKFAKKQYFNHFGKTNKPTKIVYNGVPKTFSSKGSKKNYHFIKTFICSADWRAHKRLDAIVKAFKCLEGNVGLVVLGDCKNKIPGENIIYTGKVPSNKLPEYIRGADAAVHLSWLDCSPNVIYEFIACGLPVLCSHNGGTKEIVRDNGIVLKLEKDYKFNRVDLYHPPSPDPDVVQWGMQEILEMKKLPKREDVYMKHVVDEYIGFMCEE